MPYTPYTDLSPLPIGANPQQWVQASRWNPVVSSSSVIHNIVAYGAISAANGNDPSLAVNDCADAFYAAIAAWSNQAITPENPGPTGGIYVPEGNWYISRPIVIPSKCILFGDGRESSSIIVGPGTPATPNLVQGFAGPTLYLTNGNIVPENAPVYTVPLVGAVGRSLSMLSQSSAQGPNPLYLHDSYAWSIYMGAWFPTTSMCIRFWVRLDETLVPGQSIFKAILGSRGPDCWGPTLPPEVAYGLHAYSSDGVTLRIRAILTTAPSWTTLINSPQFGNQHVIDSGGVTPGVPINVELNYDGSFIDFYVNGVSQGHIAATGSVIRAPWEGTTIGWGGPEISDNGGLYVQSFGGAIDSIEMANIPRHTGTGSFTPPTAKYVADSNTLALYNWDQGEPGPGLPFVIGQAAIPVSNFSSIPPTLGTALVRHYIRLRPGGLAEGVYVHDIQVVSRWCGSGLIAFGTNVSKYENLISLQPCQFGLKVSDPYAYFTSIYNYHCARAGGVALQSTGDVYKVNTLACPIDNWIIAGTVSNCQAQPAYNGYCPFIFGPGFSGSSIIQATSCGGDFEANDYTRAVAGGMMVSSIGSFLSTNSFWATGGIGVFPPFLYINAPESGFATHINDHFEAGPAANVLTIEQYRPIPGNVTMFNCGWRTRPGIPFTNALGFVTQMNGVQVNNQQGISTTDTQANNLAGTVSVMGGYTSGTVVFATPEADERYNLTFAVKGHVGSAPAAGSTVIAGYTTTATGFVLTVGADPGGTCLLTFTWHLIRTQGDPLLYQYVPAIPSTFTNPLVTASPTGNFAVGVTIIPVSGNVFAFNTSTGNQTVFEVGTPSTNWYDVELNLGNSASRQVGPLQNFIDSYVANGRLAGVANPGTHNLVTSVFQGYLRYYTDGVGFDLLPQVASPGTQQTPIRVGQHAGGTQTLTVATLRNLKVDTTAAQCITIEPDSGPQAGHSQGAMFGDQMTLGYLSSSAAGGYATQIAQARYATKYYWLAAANQSAVLFHQGFTGSVEIDFWGGWGGNQTLVGICIMAGFSDLLIWSSTAVDIMAGLQRIIEGSFATATFAPPVNVPGNLPSGITPNRAAWAEYVPPTSGTASCVINGVNFPCTFTTNAQTTVTNLANAINASAPTNTLVTANAIQESHGTWVVFCVAKAGGAAGNGIPTTTDGLGGAFWYPGFVTQFGVDTTCVIGTVTFPANFDTNAATTVNDLVSRVNADPTTSALVTASNVANQMLITANAIGAAANSIELSSDRFGGCGWAPSGLGTNMTGGVNGAIPNAIPTIVLCTVPPFGDTGLFTAGKETQRVALNTAITAYAAAHVANGVVLADADVTLRNPANHSKILPAYLSSDLTNPNNAGHTALFGLINPLLP